MNSNSRKENLQCPYTGCGKTIDKLATVTDTSTIPRQTHYACPHCSSELGIIVKGMEIVGVEATEYPKVLSSPAKCAHYFGFLNLLPEVSSIPDECLVCPKVLQCSVRRR
jgi:hypothetical protein